MILHFRIRLICGKDVFLNCLSREIDNSDFRQELDKLIKALQTVSKYYHFSETEKNAALMLYRCNQKVSQRNGALSD